MSMAFSIYEGICSGLEGTKHLSADCLQGKTTTFWSLLYARPEASVPKPMVSKGKLSINHFFFRSSLIVLMLLPEKAKGFLIFLVEAGISP